MDANALSKIREWLRGTFPITCCQPNFDKMTTLLISSCNIQDIDDVELAINQGDFDRVIKEYYQHLRELLRNHARRNFELAD